LREIDPEMERAASAGIVDHESQLWNRAPALEAEEVRE
jgi:hypothetical protein